MKHTKNFRASGLEVRACASYMNDGGFKISDLVMVGSVFDSAEQAVP